MQREQDLEYYVEILRKANIMESTDAILCKSLLIKCIGIIRETPELFIEKYPKRKKDEVQLLDRIRRLKGKYADTLEDDEGDIVEGSSFSSFIGEAMERAKILASRGQFKQAQIVLKEAKQMAKDYSLPEQIDIIKKQEKLYRSEKKKHDKKETQLTELTEGVKNSRESKLLPDIVDGCNKVIPIARELHKEKIAEDHESLLTETEEEIEEKNSLMPKLIQELQQAEKEGNTNRVIELSESITENARQLRNDEIEVQFAEKAEKAKEEIQIKKADLATQVDQYIQKLNEDRKNNNVKDAINHCNRIIEIYSELGHSDKIHEYNLILKEIQELLNKNQEKLRKQLDTLEGDLHDKETAKEYHSALETLSKVMDIATRLEEEEKFKEYSAKQTELQDKSKKEDARIKRYLGKMAKKMETHISKHEVSDAIDVCKKILSYLDKNNRSDLAEHYQERLKELEILYEKEQNIVDSQLTQLKNEIDSNIAAGNNPLAVENINKIINIASKNQRKELVKEYSALKENYVGEQALKAEEALRNSKELKKYSNNLLKELNLSADHLQEALKIAEEMIKLDSSEPNQVVEKDIAKILSPLVSLIKRLEE